MEIPINLVIFPGYSCCITRNRQEISLGIEFQPSKLALAGPEVVTAHHYSPFLQNLLIILVLPRFRISGTIVSRNIRLDCSCGENFMWPKIAVLFLLSVPKESVTDGRCHPTNDSSIRWRVGRRMRCTLIRCLWCLFTIIMKSLIVLSYSAKNAFLAHSLAVVNSRSSLKDYCLSLRHQHVWGARVLVWVLLKRPFKWSLWIGMEVMQAHPINWCVLEPMRELQLPYYHKWTLDEAKPEGDMVWKAKYFWCRMQWQAMAWLKLMRRSIWTERSK